MKNKVLLCGLTAALLATAACSSTAPGNANTTTNTTTTTTTSNTANRPAAPPASNTSNTSNSNATSNSSAATEGAQDFTLVNATGVEIDKVFISPHDSKDWEEDILGQDVLDTDESVDITFSPKERAKLWDLKIVDSKGNSIEWESLNLLEISKVTLHYKNGKAWADLE